MKAINHQLNWMMDKSLQDFIPAKQDILHFGQDVAHCKVVPVDQMHIIKFASWLPKRHEVPTAQRVFDSSMSRVR